MSDPRMYALSPLARLVSGQGNTSIKRFDIGWLNSDNASISTACRGIYVGTVVLPVSGALFCDESLSSRAC